MADEVKRKIVDLLETTARLTLQWISKNDEEIGNIVYNFHVIFAISVITLYIVSRVIYPAIWFQLLVYGIIFMLWAQHIFLNTCVLTSLEKRLTKKRSKTAVDSVIEFFGMPIQRETRIGVTLLTSTITMGMLTIELIGRLTLAIQNTSIV